MGFSALKYVDELVEAGVPEKQAKAQVLVLQDFKDSEIATKGDLARTEAALKGDLAQTEAALKGDLAQTEAALKGDLARTEAALRGEIKELDLKIENVRAELKSDIALVHKDIVLSRYLTILGLPTVSGLVFAALKYLSMI